KHPARAAAARYAALMHTALRRPHAPTPHVASGRTHTTVRGRATPHTDAAHSALCPPGHPRPSAGGMHLRYQKAAGPLARNGGTRGPRGGGPHEPATAPPHGPATTGHRPGGQLPTPAGPVAPT